MCRGPTCHGALAEDKLAAETDAGCMANLSKLQQDRLAVCLPVRCMVSYAGQPAY